MIVMMLAINATTRLSLLNPSQQSFPAYLNNRYYHLLPL